MRSLFSLSKYVKNARKNLAIIAFFSIFYAITNSVWPQFIRWIINNAPAHFVNKTSQQNIIFILIFTLAMVTLGLLLSLFDALSWWYSSRTNALIQTDLNKKIYAKLQSLSISYFENNLSGSLQQKLYGGVAAFQDWMMSMSQNLIEPGAIIVISTVLIFINSREVGTLLLVSILIFILSFLRTNKKSDPLYTLVNKNTEQINGRISESFSSFTTIRTMSAENIFKKSIYKLVDSLQRNNYDLSDLWGKSIGRRSLLNRTVLFSSLGIMLFKLSKGRTNVADIVLIVIYLEQVQSNLLYFSRFFTSTINNENRAKRLLEFINTEPDFKDTDNAQSLRLLDNYELIDVSFDYPDGKKGAVSQIDISIPKGKTIALVGPSGVGKSTIIKLLLRFYPPTRGELRINGHNAEEYTQNSIRQHIGVVMQDVALFNDTILKNLQAASPKTTRSKIIAAAKQAHAHEFIKELPQGYDTLVGNRGIKLSGGQKQRIAIARAILKNPQLIILDEATSALDSESEKLVQEGLQGLLKNRSALIIAHRLSTIQHADEIIVLQRGKIVERGTHQELINKQKGVYKKLFELQSYSGKITL